MPTGLKRYQHEQHAHYITFTCFHRQPRLHSTAAKELFEATLERVRRWYGIDIFGYVVMPEHVHLLISEPERKELATAIQMLKQIVARKVAVGWPTLSPAFGEGWVMGGPPFRPFSAKEGGPPFRPFSAKEGGPPFRPLLAKGGHSDVPFWQKRYYDFNVWSPQKFREKLRYIHRNPVRRGLVAHAEDWPWSSFRHYRTGAEGTVEIESPWTAWRRERMGLVPKLRREA